MPSARRLRLLCILVVAGLLAVFLTSRLRRSDDADASSRHGFYHKTVTAIEKARGDGQVVLDAKTGKAKGRTPLDKDADGDVDEDDKKLTKEMSDRLKAAEQQAKDLANAKSPNKPDPPSNVIGIGSSAGGQIKKANPQGSGLPGVWDGDEGPVIPSDEDHQAEEELKHILRKSPVIIFSKSYCPYSKRAKGVLLEKYLIDPPPHVIELDTHPLGPQLQKTLAAMTGRKTVPNIMVSGTSIGGGDDIAELDAQKGLASKIELLGGSQVTVKERFVEDASTS